MTSRATELCAEAGLVASREYSVPWEHAERELGTWFPSDYKEYVRRFGPGAFDDYLYVCVPGVGNDVVELGARPAGEHQGRRRRTRINRRYTPPFPLFPEPGGWLPFAFTTGGDVLYWVTSDADPDRWTVAGRPGRGGDLGYFAGGFADFLREFVHDTIELHVIAETESEVPIAFEPDTGAWPGEPAKRLEPYGSFEEPPES